MGGVFFFFTNMRQLGPRAVCSGRFRVAGPGYLKQSDVDPSAVTGSGRLFVPCGGSNPRRWSTLMYTSSEADVPVVSTKTQGKYSRSVLGYSGTLVLAGAVAVAVGGWAAESKIRSS